MHSVPDWLPIFFMVGVLLVLVAVPARILWDASRKSRERDDRLGGICQGRVRLIGDGKGHGALASGIGNNLDDVR